MPATPQDKSGYLTNPYLVRFFGWANLALLCAFLFNNFATFWGGLPGSGTQSPIAIFQAALYPAAIFFAAFWVWRYPSISLREDSARFSDMNSFFIRACFWAVLYLGVVDALISFLRVEDFLPLLVGAELAENLGRSQFRGTYVHYPLMVLGVLTACFTRTLGFYWFALLIVIAELIIVIFRFIFSYEQAFMSDLVRFWYGALFLFASAYTLIEEGHVRVDIIYAGLSDQAKGWVNYLGTIVLGLPICWTTLYLGMSSKAAIINAPILNFETTQAGFGMYVKYMLAAFLAIFAISMLIQFIGYLMGAAADVNEGDASAEPLREMGN